MKILTFNTIVLIILVCTIQYEDEHNVDLHIHLTDHGLVIHGHTYDEETGEYVCPSS